jgi:hypothetical protein
MGNSKLSCLEAPATSLNGQALAPGHSDSPGPTRVRIIVVIAALAASEAKVVSQRGGGCHVPAHEVMPEPDGNCPPASGIPPSRQPLTGWIATSAYRAPLVVFGFVR